MSNRAISVIQIYCLLYRVQPPVKGSPDEERDLDWVRRNEVFDVISPDRAKALAKQAYRQIRAHGGEFDVQNDMRDLTDAGFPSLFQDEGPDEYEYNEGDVLGDLGDMYDSDADSTPSEM